MAELTQNELRLMYAYDSSTGVFTRLVTRGRWRRGEVAGFSDRNGHKLICIGKKQHFAHRLAWLYVYGKWPEQVIDHINGDRSDNRIANLRDVTMLTNMQNQRSHHRDNKHKLLGVTFHKRDGKFQAQISINKKHTYLGLFDTAEAAHAAYLSAKRAHHQGGTI